MNRVVITGLGVVAPNAIGIQDFEQALKRGVSGIRYHPELERLHFSCCIAGQPEPEQAYILRYFDPVDLLHFSSDGVLYGVIAGMQAWQDAGLPLPGDLPDWDSGTIFGNGSSGVAKFRESIYKVDDGQTRRLGSTIVGQTMVSGVSAYLGGKLGMGNQVSTNASACTTGTESLLMCYERIKNGLAKRMLAGSTCDSGPYIWAGFDAMKVCTYKYNDQPERGSRPMSATASGFVPGSGAGALLLESLESALCRGAFIYAEIAGGNINSGGQRGSGSMTAPNNDAVQHCIRSAMLDAGIDPSEVDVINGHLTGTKKDPLEIRNWQEALGRRGEDLPFIQALKSHIGHCLTGAGSIECVAAALQLRQGFLFPNLNAEDLHPEIMEMAADKCIPRKLEYRDIRVIAKSGFGFGDVNACVLFKKYES